MDAVMNAETKARIAKVREEVGDDFDEWLRRATVWVEADRQRRRFLSPFDPPRSWDEAGRWINRYFSPDEPRGTERRIFGAAYVEMILEAWSQSTERLVQSLLKLQVLDPTFRSMRAKHVLYNDIAKAEILADNDPELIAEFERLKNSRPWYNDGSDGYPHAHSAIEVALLMAHEIAIGAIGAYAYAAVESLRSKKGALETLRLTGDEAHTYAEMQIRERDDSDLVLIDQSLKEQYEPAGKRAWRRTDRWTHVFVGPNAEYKVVTVMKPGEALPVLVEVVTRPSWKGPLRGSGGVQKTSPAFGGWTTASSGRAAGGHQVYWLD